MSRPYFKDEVVGGDGKRYYNVVDSSGSVINSNVLLQKNYTKLTEGTLISSAEIIRLLTPDSIKNYLGVKEETVFGDSIVTTYYDTENSNDVILVQTTSFGASIVTQYDYYQDGAIFLTWSQTTSFGDTIVTAVA